MPASGRIDDLRKRYEENPRRFFAPLANEYRKSGDLEQAIALCRMHLEEAPANLNGQIVFGQALYEAGTLDDARGAFEAAIALDPENLIALRHLGDIAREQGSIPTARQWYRRVLDADRRNEEVLAIMEELTVIEASGGTRPTSDSAGQAEGGVGTIELEEPPMRAPAPSRPSILSLIGPPSQPDVDSDATVIVAATSVQESHEQHEVEVATVDDVPAPMPTPPEADAIDFGMVDTSPSEPSSGHDEPPDSSFGFDVDLGAAASIPVATSVGDTGDFGVVELEDDAPFRETEEIKPPGIETAADSLIANIDLHDTIDLDSIGTVHVESIEPEAEPAPAKLELVRSDEQLDTVAVDEDEDSNTIDLVVEDESADALGLVVDDEPADPIGLVSDDEPVDAISLVPDHESVDAIGLIPDHEPVDAISLVPDHEPVSGLHLVLDDDTPVDKKVDEVPSLPAETVPRRPTPVVFSFDLSVDEATRPPTPLSSDAVPATPDAELDSAPIDDLIDEPALATEHDDEDIREMETPLMQPAVEAFATETMAELYVKQGLRHEAIAVYRQLVDARPNDVTLRHRLAELEEDGHVAAGSTAREFFAALSRRTSKGRASGTHKRPDAPTPRGSLDRLFGGASVARLDEHAAESLSAAFGSGPTQPEESAVDRVFSTRPATPPGR